MTRVEVTTADSGDVLRRDYTDYPSWDRRDETETQVVGGVPTTPAVQRYHYDETHWVQQVVDDTTGRSIDYAYDNNGNTLSRVDGTLATPEETVFVYDSRNQLVQTTRGPPGNQAIAGRYDYDYLGMRIRHLDSERGDIEAIVDETAILDERDPNTGTLVAHYNYADRLLSLKTPTSNQYYHFAALDTTANLSDETGAVQVSYRTDVWGEVTAEEGESPNRQIFTGQEWDENTGLVYFGARYVSAQRTPCFSPA
ncbi:MAG: hypothetical protein MJB57_01025 [Gemmatimonadetes bacterium]|nr:hypothetical protein [Gemmatimonadota bacterium]